MTTCPAEFAITSSRFPDTSRKSPGIETLYFSHLSAETLLFSHLCAETLQVGSEDSVHCPKSGAVVGSEGSALPNSAAVVGSVHAVL